MTDTNKFTEVQILPQGQEAGGFSGTGREEINGSAKQ